MSAMKRRAGGTTPSFVSYVLEQLAELEGLGCRAMFGGHGLYLGRSFFGIVFDGRLYFKTHPHTRAHYADHGMLPFRPNDGHVLKTYYEVPADVLESPHELASWATAAAAPAEEGTGRRRPTRKR